MTIVGHIGAQNRIEFPQYKQFSKFSLPFKIFIKINMKKLFYLIFSTIFLKDIHAGYPKLSRVVSKTQRRFQRPLKEVRISKNIISINPQAVEMDFESFLLGYFQEKTLQVPSFEMALTYIPGLKL